jgi:hypothetical protein
VPIRSFESEVQPGTILFLNLDYRKDVAVEDKPPLQAAG